MLQKITRISHSAQIFNALKIPQTSMHAKSHPHCDKRDVNDAKMQQKVPPAKPAQDHRVCAERFSPGRGKQLARKPASMNQFSAPRHSRANNNATINCKQTRKKSKVILHTGTLKMLGDYKPVQFVLIFMVSSQAVHTC